jgi:hypothetical protein
MNAGAPTEAQDPATKEMHSDGAGKAGKVDGAGPAETAAVRAPSTNATSGKRRAAAGKAPAEQPAAKKVSARNNPGDSAAPAATRQPTEKMTAAETNRAGASRGDADQSAHTAGQAADNEPAERRPRRRGILLHTRPDGDGGDITDDAKSLSWMADQAVKALNAVKASQMEQAQMLKARGELSEEADGEVSPDEDVDAGLAGPPGVAPASDMMMATSPSTHDAVGAEVDAAVTPEPTPSSLKDQPAAGQPLGSVQGTPAVPVAAVGHRKVVSGALQRTIVVLGTLVVVGLLGYRHWFAGSETPGEAPVPASIISEPAGPPTAADMAPPPVSVVAVPARSAGRGKPPSEAARMPPGPEPSANTPAATATPSNEPIPPPGPQAGTAGVDTSQPVAERRPAGATREAGQFPTVTPKPAPAATPRAVAEPVQPVQAVPPSRPLAGTTSAGGPQPAAEYPPAGATQDEGHSPAVPAAPAAPATAAPRPAAKQPPASTSPSRYPANRYGYYPPPSSWQPYYHRAYPQGSGR